MGRDIGGNKCLGSKGVRGKGNVCMCGACKGEWEGHTWHGMGSSLLLPIIQISK